MRGHGQQVRHQRIESHVIERGDALRRDLENIFEWAFAMWH